MIDEKKKNNNDINLSKEKIDYIDKIIFGKYRVIEKIGQGSQSLVFRGEHIQNKENVAIKMENQNAADCLLKKEIYTLFRLKNNEGIANIITCGRFGENFVLIEKLYGKSLDVLYLELSKKFTLLDICQIGIQCLDRLEFVHSKGIIHCDIKPENFVIGLKDPNVIYLIDFGLGHNYKSLKTGKHIDFSFTGYMTGTARYASRNALRGKELSRRDDVESFIYMILFFFSKKLPWQGLRAKTMGEKYKKIYKSKVEFNYKEFCQKYPQEIVILLEYILNLKFKEKPNYEFMRTLFIKILERQKLYVNDYFSWMSGIKEEDKKRRRSRSESKKIIKDQKKKIHSSILKCSANTGINSLKVSTMAFGNLKLSKNISINIGESQATIYEKDEENKIEDDNDDILNIKEVEEKDIEKEEEEENAENTDNNNNNLLSTGAKNKYKILDEDLKKELEIIKEEDKEDEEENDEDINISKKIGGGSEHVYVIEMNEYDFLKKSKHGSKYKEKMNKNDQKLMIYSKLVDFGDNNSYNKRKTEEQDTSEGKIPDTNKKSIQNDEIENEIINDDIKKKEDDVQKIEDSQNESHSIKQKEEKEGDVEIETKKEEQEEKKEIKDEKEEKKESEEKKTNEEKEIKDEKKEEKKEKIEKKEDENEKKYETEEVNITSNNNEDNINNEIKNNSPLTTRNTNNNNNNINIVKQISDNNNNNNNNINNNHHHISKPKKANYTDDKIKYSSIGSDGSISYMKKGNLTYRPEKRKKAKTISSNNKNKKDNCNII